MLIVSRMARLAGPALLAAFCGSPALAVDLFSTPRPVDVAAAAAPHAERGATRQRSVAVNPAAIDAGAVAPELRIELFPGVSATFRATSVEPAFGGGSVIQASAGETGDATLVAVDGAVTGRVRLGGATYAIRPLGGRLHAVQEVSRALLPPKGPERIAPQAPAQSAPKVAPAPGAADDVATVDVLFVYTAKAKAAAGNIKAEIDLAVAITNEAYRASGVKMRMRLVKTLQSGAYDEDAREYGDVLNDLTGFGEQASFFDKTRKARDRAGADFVVLLREGGGYCGLAWVITEPEGADAWAFSEISRGLCVSVDTVAHEVGHNMGLRHDRYVTKAEDGGEFPASVYNFGFVSVPALAMDIMAYENECWDAGAPCQYKRLFSSPKLKVNGRRFGVKAGKPGAADGVRWLNEIRWIAAGLRPTGGSAPAAPTQVATGQD